MSSKEKMRMMEGNEAAASIAHRLSEVVAIYPITPSSNMGEFSDAWASEGVTNIWGKVPDVLEMQSEAGAIGVCHGALQAGCHSTTFTASQGLLLMIPSLYKIVGQMLPFAMHVSARTVAGQALSIFGDHSDVMTCRQIGLALLASSNVQEAHDMALIAHTATLKSRVPFLHFFDGFRTSHELNKIHYLSDDVLRQMVSGDDAAFLARNALNPDNPMIRGTAQNPDVHFQIKEAVNKDFEKVYGIVKETMQKFADITGRRYDLVRYHGDPDAERVIVIMGSGAETVQETVKYLNSKGEKVGVLTVHLYRPFPAHDVVSALPGSVKTLLVLDRTKEIGSAGEPLYKDVLCALAELGRTNIKVLGGRYGISSKEFTPAMVKAVFENRDKNHFTVGINDDVTHTSLPVDESFHLDAGNVTSAVFFGLGSDGTVGANKNSIKII
ncbi:MAG: pyruvate:ferredoxin (flavodoxin) oxidoreductase, partial [Alphaproteobacteria bacterium]|nr:pyruvate:ferredoxin (flavodoxin) oxidoreductase [Alphaproteobacteria bacterium]